MKREIIESIKKTNPRIHSITNTITINDCANIILAAGGSAVMASDPEEVSDMMSLCDGLVLNLGAVASREAMFRAGEMANSRSCPVVFDPVAAGSTALRRQTSLRLMNELELTVIRGNAAEIHTLSRLSEMPSGGGMESFVDADQSQVMRQANLKQCLLDAGRLSRQTGSIIVVSGIDDLVVQGERYQVFEGGSVFSSRITGSGCMLSELIAVCLASLRKDAKDVHDNIFTDWEAVCTAVEWMNGAAEYAENQMKKAHVGTMTYRMYLIDAISRSVFSCE